MATSRPLMRACNCFRAAVVIAALLMQACDRQPSDPLQRHAEHYVELATAIGTFRYAEVDAYFGPPELDRRTEDPATPAALLARAEQLAARVASDPQAASSARGRRLQTLVNDLIALLEVLGTTSPLPLAEEARKLYGLSIMPASDTSTRLAELDRLLPGTGATAFKLATLQNQLVIPADKRQAVFLRALAECKRRTAEHWRLPENEQLAVEFTREVASAWYRYEGAGRGRLQVNPLAIAFVGAALDVACHEGYPGHHAQFLLRESHAAPGGLALEERVVLLRSPDSVLREGAANYGIDLAWTPQERLAFERDVLFPLAGLQASQTERAAQVHRIVTELGEAAAPILQEYRDKAISFNTATFRLEREAMIASPAALLEFFDRHGAYVVGYTVARSRVAEFIEQQTQASGSDAWQVLLEVLTGTRAGVLQSRPKEPEAAAEPIRRP